MPTPAHIQRIRQVIGHDLLLTPGVNAVITDEQGRVLLQKRADNGRWGLPGGLIEPGESVLTAVVREVQEETGFIVEVGKLSGVYSAPDSNNLQTYPNGDRIHVIALVFHCTIIGRSNEPTDGESTEVGFFFPSELPVETAQHHQERIQDAFARAELRVT